MTEREVVLRERQAFADGAVRWVSECRERTHSYPPGKTVTLDEITADAARKFPLPTVTRPRVVLSGDHEWKYENGQLYWRLAKPADLTTQWKALDAGDSLGVIKRYEIMWPSPERIRMWADLIATPNETVEDA